MAIYEIPQFVPRPVENPEPANFGLQPRAGYVPNFRERSASKKVDDLSRRESKHDMDPKHDPKHNGREMNPDATKPGGFHPQGGKPVPGTVKK